MSEAEQIIERDREVADVAEDLRHFVDNMNKRPVLALRGGVYRALDPDKIYKTRVGAFEIGYGLKELDPVEGIIGRLVSITPVGDAGQDEIDAAMVAVLDTCFNRQHGKVEVDVVDGTLLLSQAFMVSYLVNRNPGLVSISGVN